MSMNPTEPLAKMKGWFEVVTYQGDPHGPHVGERYRIDCATQYFVYGVGAPCMFTWHEVLRFDEAPIQCHDGDRWLEPRQ